MSTTSYSIDLERRFDSWNIHTPARPPFGSRQGRAVYYELLGLGVKRRRGFQSSEVGTWERQPRLIRETIFLCEVTTD